MARIPKYLRDYLKQITNREKMLKKYGAKAFLDPDGLKYPVINYKSGEFDLVLINSAISLAKIHNNNPIVKKGEVLRTNTLKALNEISTMGAIARTESYTKSTKKNNIGGYSSIVYPTVIWGVTYGYRNYSMANF